MLHQCLKLDGGGPLVTFTNPTNLPIPTLQHHNFSMTGQICEINIAADLYNIYNM